MVGCNWRRGRGMMLRCDCCGNWEGIERHADLRALTTWDCRIINNNDVYFFKVLYEGMKIGKLETTTLIISTLVTS